MDGNRTDIVLDEPTRNTIIIPTFYAKPCHVMMSHLRAVHLGVQIDSATDCTVGRAATSAIQNSDLKVQNNTIRPIGDPPVDISMSAATTHSASNHT